MNLFTEPSNLYLVKMNQEQLNLFIELIEGLIDTGTKEQQQLKTESEAISGDLQSEIEDLQRLRDHMNDSWSDDRINNWTD